MEKRVQPFYWLLFITIPTWPMELEKNKATIDHVIASLDAAQSSCCHALSQAEHETCTALAITQVNADLNEKLGHVRTSVEVLGRLISATAPSLALTEEYARLHILAERARERLTTANIVLRVAPSWLHTSGYAAHAWTTELRDLNCELYSAQQFVTCFFAALASIDVNVAHTKQRLRPIQEATDGLIHMGKTVEQTDPPELAPLINATTRLGLVALTRLRQYQKNQDPAALLDVSPAGASSETSDGESLQTLIEKGHVLVNNIDAVRDAGTTVTDFCKSRGPKTLAVLDQLLDKLVHIPAEQRKAKEELTMEEFVSRHLGDDLMQKRVTDVFDFLIEPYCGPALLRVAQRLPSFMLNPLIAAQDREEILSALQNVGIQPSDISLLSDKIKQQFKITPKHQQQAKKITREILAKITQLFKPENAEKIISATRTAADTAEKIIETLNDSATTQAMFSIALDGLETISQHHSEVTHEEQEIIAQFKELGLYAQRALAENLQTPYKNYEAQEE